MTTTENGLNVLPAELRAIVEQVSAAVLAQLEEVRVRQGRALEISYGGTFAYVCADGRLTGEPHEAYKPTEYVCQKMLERATNHSLYAVEEELRRGFITVAGGHRIGIAGRTILDGGVVRGLREVTAFNLRIARAVPGAARELLPQLLNAAQQTVLPALIVGAPQTGKTTIIRDLARMISSGAWGHPQAAHWRGRKVSIVDERSELAACVRGVPTFDVGPRTDVLDACPKAEGMMMMLRSMSPDVMIVDEIGRPADAAAIEDASHAGIAIIATAHARDLADAASRPVLRRLLEAGAFACVIELSRQPSDYAADELRPTPSDYAADELRPTPSSTPSVASPPRRTPTGTPSVASPPRPTPTGTPSVASPPCRTLTGTSAASPAQSELRPAPSAQYERTVQVHYLNQPRGAKMNA